MLITSNGEVKSLKEENLIVFQTNNTLHYVKGFIYISGFCSGEESIKVVHDYLEANNKIPFNRLYGSFIYLLINDDEKNLFPCDSMLRSVYISKYAASDSFLELVLYHKENNYPLDFDTESVCEYYSLGGVYFGKTFVKSIRVLPNNQYIKWKDGKMIIMDKGIEDMDGDSNITNPKEFFGDLCVAMKNRHVSVSLTGGYDSRMVFAMINKSVDPNLFFSANVSTKDGDIAKRVANSVGKELDIIRTEKPILTENVIVEMIDHSDGMQPLDLNSDSRLNNARTELQKQGIDLQLTGDGGVLHKDWEWMQDLPFYHKKKTNINRFYHQRIAFSCSAPFCGARIKELFDNQEQRFAYAMRKYIKPTNTQSYDALYYYINGNRSNRYNYVGTKRFTLYAPLNELDLVRYSYHLPRRKRFFYNFIREMTTFADKRIAIIPTNYGTTASSDKLYLFRDSFIQIKEYGVKGIRMIKRKLKLESKGESVLDWSLEKDLRDLSVSLKAIEWAKQAEFLNFEAQIEEIPFPNLMRLVHLYILSNKYDIN